MLLPRIRSRQFSSAYLLPSLLGLVTLVFICGEIAQADAQRYNGPPRYSYDHLPKTSFSCKGRLPGRYYPDPETDCQMFHVCVKMTQRDVQDFKFLCPNGTVFDSEHQVCIDYFQVVCHSEVGTNPLGQIFEIFKLSSGHTVPDLDAGKLSLVSPDSVERNTLGDDFQVEEYNHNHQATQNSVNFNRSDRPSSPKPTKSQKAKEDIFFSNKGFGSQNYNFAPSTTRRTPTTTTTTTTEPPSSSTPRRPSLETFESYETESFSGFIPTRNSFNSFDRPQQQQDPTPDFDASTEDFTPRDDVERFRNTEVSTTARPLVFQNTFRTTLSHLSSTTRPSAQTFQQQALRFNDEYFTRIPSTTRRPVSKAGFFLHSTTSEDYYTPEFSQPTPNPFVSHRRTQSTTAAPSTTIRPSVLFQSNSGTVRPSNRNTGFQYDSTTTTTRAPTTTTTTTELPSTTEYFSRYRQTEDDFETRQTTYSGFVPSTSNFFNTDKSNKDEGFGGKTSAQRQFPPELSSQYVEEETLRPRNINGVSNAQNSFNTQPQAEVRPRDNFGFSTVPPPTTAEPFSTPPPTTAASAVTQQETAQTLAARLQGQLFKKITTTRNPEKFSIFFGRSTPSVISDERESGATTPRPRQRVRSTTTSPSSDQSSTTTEITFERRGRGRRVSTTTVAPEDSAAPAASSSQRPLRRGVRRRIRPGQRAQGKQFDPQLKYTRRRFESGRLNNGEGEQKPEEIFNAEASVFRGDPAINNFYQEQRKGENSGPQKTNDKVDQAEKAQPAQQRQPENHYEQLYGHRVAANQDGGDAPPRNLNNGEGPRRPPLPPGSQGQIRRRVVKRLRPKNGTLALNQTTDGSPKQFVVTGSTLRPVTRINIKTKLGGKISTTFRTTEITDGTSTPSSTTTTTKTTTEEPELVTAPEEVVQAKRQRNHHPHRPESSSPPSVSTAFPKLFAKKPKPFSPKPLNNDSHLVIKVLSEKPVPPTPSFPSSPLSIKKPILSGSVKKFGKPGGAKKISNKNSEDEESQTRSPDYDYAYYNSDDASDYDAETSKLDHKSYGTKPNGK